MLFLLVLILWVLCAGFAALLAPSRGRSAGAWFFAGLLFGVFGLVALFLAEDLSKQPAPSAATIATAPAAAEPLTPAEISSLRFERVALAVLAIAGAAIFAIAHFH